MYSRVREHAQGAMILRRKLKPSSKPASRDKSPVTGIGAASGTPPPTDWGRSVPYRWFAWVAWRVFPGLGVLVGLGGLGVGLGFTVGGGFSVGVGFVGLGVLVGLRVLVGFGVGPVGVSEMVAVGETGEGVGVREAGVTGVNVRVIPGVMVGPRELVAVEVT